jgi:hypothetical protein
MTPTKIIVHHNGEIDITQHPPHTTSPNSAFHQSSLQRLTHSQSSPPRIIQSSSPTSLSRSIKQQINQATAVAIPSAIRAAIAAVDDDEIQFEQSLERLRQLSQLDRPSIQLSTSQVPPHLDQKQQTATNGLTSFDEEMLHQ